MFLDIDLSFKHSFSWPHCNEENYEHCEENIGNFIRQTQQILSHRYTDPKIIRNFIFIDYSKGHLRKDIFHQSPRRAEIFFVLSHVNFWTKSCLRLWSKLDLKVEDFFEGTGIFFPHKCPSFLYNKIIFPHMACALKEELLPFSNNSI